MLEVGFQFPSLTSNFKLPTSDLQLQKIFNCTKRSILMSITVRLRSKKKNEINRFLSLYYDTNMGINDDLTWKKDYKNPIEVSDIIGVYIDNIDSYDLHMWLCLDKNVYINITNSNGNDVIRYLFERFPY